MIGSSSTIAANLTDVSACELAARIASGDLSASEVVEVGVQVVARRWRDDAALAVMVALESHFRNRPDYPARPPLE